VFDRVKRLTNRFSQNPGTHVPGSPSYPGTSVPGLSEMSAPVTDTVHVALGERSYDIVIAEGVLPSLAERVGPWLGRQRGSRKALLVTDTNVALHANTVAGSLRGAGWSCEVLTIEAGEASKRLDVISGMYDRLVTMQADRRTVVFAVGGGVVGDAAGFAAATYARGLPFIQVPTTLLADVDSSVGGKVGVNHPQAKNLIGAFHQPVGVVVDTSVLSTLPDREFRAGLAEVVKYGVILDAEFFDWLERNVAAINVRESGALRHAIARSCRLKANVVEQDEYERTGLRAVLNYGHTFGHAFEALAGYGELLHGEAVAIGMVYAGRLAERLGRITAEDSRRQIDLLKAFHLPTSLVADASGIGRRHLIMPPDDVIDRMRLDKKSVGGKLRFVLPTRIGHVELVDGVPEPLVRQLLFDLQTHKEHP
jgi:3-dehydroquinate synthase